MDPSVSVKVIFVNLLDVSIGFNTNKAAIIKKSERNRNNSNLGWCGSLRNNYLEVPLKKYETPLLNKQFA